MDNESFLDKKNIMIMKLLHYFIIEKNYDPIIIQGIDNEIWLENLDEDYKVIRIVSGYIHNDEQFDFDIFKTRRIIKKIKRKTLSFNIHTLSLFLDLGENITRDNSYKDIKWVRVNDIDDVIKDKVVKEEFPDIKNGLIYNEEGVELFNKITYDINEHNKRDASKIEKVFSSKFPMITYLLIAINILLYIIPIMFGSYNSIINKFCIYGPDIRAGEYYRLITGIFLHGNIIHLAFNCYSLYVIGTQIESFYGKFKYLLIYFFSGLCGSLFSILFNQNVASIGASGAIFGLLGSLVYFGYYYRVYLGNVVKSQIIPLIIMNLILGFILTGVDNFAHIGGLLGGFIISTGLGVKDKGSTFERFNGLIISLLFLLFVIFMTFVYASK